VETVAIIAYLQSRMDGPDGLNATVPDAEAKIDLLIAKAFVDIIADSDIKGGKNTRTRNDSDQCPQPNEAEDEDYDQDESAATEIPFMAKSSKGAFWTSMQSHGALFHLSQVAILDAKAQYANGLPLKEIEFQTEVIVKEGVSEFKLRRVVDIVLGAKNSPPESDKWIEVKSYGRDSGSRTYAYKNGYSNTREHPLQRTWTTLKAKNSNSPVRQFFVDRVHARADAQWVNRMQWRFQDFMLAGKGPACTGKIVYGLKEPDMQYIRENYFKRLPKAVESVNGVILPTFSVKREEWKAFITQQYNPNLDDAGVIVNSGVRTFPTHRMRIRRRGSVDRVDCHSPRCRRRRGRPSILVRFVPRR
jgi:hypothetical protein